MAAPHIAALQAAGFAMQADLAPLATNVQLAAATAPLATNAQLVAMQANMNAQLAAMQANMNAQLAAMQANMNGQLDAMQATMNGQFAAMQAQLPVIGIPAISGAVSAIVQAVIAARAENNHDRSGVVYAVVPRRDGMPPPNWPAGFDRFALIRGPIAVVDALLVDYGLPLAVAVFDRRDALALYIGTTTHVKADERRTPGHCAHRGLPGPAAR